MPAHRIEFHISRGGQHVALVEYERGEAPLPEVPTPAFAKVNHTGISAMCLADSASQPIGRLRDRDQVDVIGHEAIGPDLDLVSTAPLPHQLQVAAVVLVTEERLLSTVSPLRDVVRETRGDDTCQSGHDARLSAAGTPVKN